MDTKSYCMKASEYLHRFCDVKPNRRTGSQGNKEAIAYFADIISQLGYTVDTEPFPALDYRMDYVLLTHAQQSFEVYVSPYSLGCAISTELVAVATVEELESISCKDKLLLLKDDICSEQLMPKEFVFYNPESHKHIYTLLEEKQPAAIITATSKNPEGVGALYPYPLIYDGDFDIPSVYCTEKVGEALSDLVGETLELIITAERILSTASNVRASVKEKGKEKIVIAAHIDAYEDSPGALDNASGTVVLLLLAEMLQGESLPFGIEFLAINGEDHYSAGGEMDYLRRYGDEIKHILYAINIDDVGYINGKIAYSFYEFDEARKQELHSVLNSYPDLVEGVSWFSGDHMVFVQSGKPAMAITSEYSEELMRRVTHTEKDIPDIVDVSKLVELAEALRDAIKTSTV